MYYNCWNIEWKGKRVEFNKLCGRNVWFDYLGGVEMWFGELDYFLLGYRKGFELLFKECSCLKRMYYFVLVLKIMIIVFSIDFIFNNFFKNY